MLWSQDALKNWSSCLLQLQSTPYTLRSIDTRSKLIFLLHCCIKTLAGKTCSIKNYYIQPYAKQLYFHCNLSLIILINASHLCTVLFADLYRTLNKTRGINFQLLYSAHHHIVHVKHNPVLFSETQANNPLHPNISMSILCTVLYTFPKRLTRRICFTIKSYFDWWSSRLFLWLSCLIQGWYCKEKLDFSYS